MENFEQENLQEQTNTEVETQPEIAVNEQPDADVAEQEIIPVNTDEFTVPIEQQKRKSKKRPAIISIIAILAAAIAAFVLFSSNTLSDKELQDILDNSGLEVSDAEVIRYENMKSTKIQDAKYVLFKVSLMGYSCYMDMCLDKNNDLLGAPKQSYRLANSLETYIRTRCDKNINLKLSKLKKEALENNGLAYFENQDNSLEFFKSLIDNRDLMSLNECRNALSVELTSECDELVNNSQEFHVLFESGTAFPKVIACKEEYSQYQWNYPEAYLDVMDSKTMAAFKSTFGPAYVTKTRWMPYVLNVEDGMFEQGLTQTNYQSLEQLKDFYNAVSSDE